VAAAAAVAQAAGAVAAEAVADAVGRQKMQRRKPRPAPLLALLSALALAHPAPAAPQAAPQSFATPEDAGSALAAATRAHDTASLRAIFGPGGEGVVVSGDRYADAEAQSRFAAAYDARHALIPQADGRTVLQVGDNDWPLPLPLVAHDGRWQFDTAAGAQEIINRRIGRNELEAIRTSLAYVDAQREFFDDAKQRTGTGLYAERLVSTPGHQDGLYWPAENGAPEGPLGPLVATAIDEGYPGAIVSGRRIPYQGYFFRILRAQGPNAPGGAKSYIRNGGMTDGFALIAWPASFGVSGIMTFVVDQDGIVFQKDLGPGTEQVAAGITRFEPDLSWARINLVGHDDDAAKGGTAQ
jgi:hypothetical protein